MEQINGTVIKTSGGKEGRPVAVDWAMSKDKWEETQKGKAEDKDEKPDIKVEDESSGSGSESGDDEEGSGSSSSGSEGEGGDGEEGEDKPDVEMEEPAKPKLPTVDVGSTLFVRNLPFETTEQELGELYVNTHPRSFRPHVHAGLTFCRFRSFGPLRYARITVDKFTGRSRGSGFVCYWNTEHADKAIAEAEKVAAETGANAMPVSLSGYTRQL